VHDDPVSPDPENPRVAVVMPVFNPGAFLREAVTSVRRQTVACQLILVDDGSTDPTSLEILDALRGEGEIVLSQPNRGAAAARNVGIGIATADFVLPLDADDLIEPSYAAEASRVLDERPEVGVVYCRADHFGDREGPWDLPDYSEPSMAVDNVIFVSAMFRREDWKRVGGFDESLVRGGEDWDFWLSLIDLGREVVRLPETLFHYRIHGSERSFREDELAEVFTAIFRKHEAFFVRNVDAIYKHRFETLSEVRRLREIELRAARLGRVVPPLGGWLRRGR
jgi:glycosyltransferase involved in cell wall biosynthesis